MLRSQDAIVVGPPVPSLVHWGKSADADLVYRTVVVFGPGTTNEIAQELGLPARRVAAALDELADIDAVSCRAGGSPRRGRVWSARAPGTVLAGLRRRRFPPLPARVSRGHGDIVGELPPTSSASVRYLPSRAQARARLAELNAVSQHEHLAMNPEPVFDTEAAAPAVSLDRLVLGRGVPMRVLGVHAADPDPLIRHGREPGEARPDYRVTGSVPLKLIVVDRTIALFPIDPGNAERGYLEINQTPVVTALVNLFEQHWDAARDPWELAARRLALSPREHALVRALARGDTDARAAHELRISLRSVTNTLRGLMDRLGVDNRFQLGLALGALGVVSTPNDEEAGA